MRILITGSSGQIGTNLALALQARGDEVVGVDCRPSSWTDEVQTCQMNLIDANNSDPPDGPFDVVVHLAVHVKVFEVVEQPSRALLGYEPQVPLTAGIPKGVQWTKEHGDL